ncbi:MAG: glycosyltransferase family 2 protein [Bacteroidetes bacterium]|nr:glycosyltransferase family 2 protein [Bacteroidota bacterium]
MNHLPLVSILMTAYNREKYIAEAIESVLASTYTHFELIIVDDGSKDKTVAIARTYEQDPRVKVYVNEKNLGDYPNRNRAASYAKGKYLKYVDADDYLYPGGLEVLVAMMEKFPEAGWGLCSLLQFIQKPFPFILSPREAYEYHYRGPGLFHKAPLSSIICRSVFEKENGFRPIRMAGDFEMWHRLAQRYPVVLMPDGIVWYREHNEQEVIFRNQFTQVYEQIKFDYLADQQCPLEKEMAKSIFNNERKKLKWQVIKFIVKIQLVNARLFFKLLWRNRYT